MIDSHNMQMQNRLQSIDYLSVLMYKLPFHHARGVKIYADSFLNSKKLYRRTPTMTAVIAQYIPLAYSLSRRDELALFLGIVRPTPSSRLAAMRLGIPCDSCFKLWPEMAHEALEGPGKCFTKGYRYTEMSAIKFLPNHEQYF